MTLNETFTVADREPGILTVDEVAARLRVSAWTVREAIKRGHLRSCRIGRHIRVTEKQLADFLDGGPS